MGGTLILVETDDGALSSDVWELVTVARRLSSAIGGGLGLAALGASVDAEAARRSGVDRVYVVEDSRLAEPWPDAHLAAGTALCWELDPACVITSPSLLGLEVATRLAYRLGGALVKDVTDLDVGEDGLVATRPVFGGAVRATVRVDRSPWIVVPRPRAFPATEPAAPRGDVISVRPELPAEALKTECGTWRRQKGLAQKLEQASVIVAGGRGMGGPEPFQLLHEIAGLLDGAVGASRPPCDAGWVEPALQIGLTGKTVAPDVYVAVGISGAIQHMVGCSSAQVIVAVNSDPDAPIFRQSTYGVVGEWEDVLPAFRDALADSHVGRTKSRLTEY